MLIGCWVCLTWAAPAGAAWHGESVALSIAANPTQQAEFSGSLIKRLPLHASLPGEQSRHLLGDAVVTGRPSILYEVLTEYNGRQERYYQWVDRSTEVVLKLVSQNRDWSIEYQRIHFSPQPDEYFEEPVGYTRWTRPSSEERQG